MTGASLKVTLDDVAVRAALDALVRVGKGRAALAQIGETLVQGTRERFHRQTDPDGRGWAALHPDYAAAKRGAGILREAGMRGGLMGSITWQHAGSDAVEVGTNKVYAAVHQFGAVIRPQRAKALVFRLGGAMVAAQKVTIPARPFLGVSAADREALRETLIDAAQALVAAARNGRRTG